MRAALSDREAARLAPAPDPRRPDEAPDAATPAPARDWVWVLHDDSAPAPDALERLLAAVEVAPSVAVAGCKETSWHDPGRLVRTGFTTSRLGRVVTGVEPGDVDQGQTDARDDVLAVGSAGMLVRRDVWDELGDADPATPVVGADLDLCVRARLAGHRVVVVPSAVVAHADAGRTGSRVDAPLQHRGRAWTIRRVVAHRRLVETPALLLPLTALALLAGGLLRLLARTAATEPRRGLTELGAVLAALGRPDLVWRARRRLARVRRVPRRTLAPLRAPATEVARWHRDRWARRRHRRAAGLVPLEVAAPSPARRRTALLLGVLLTAVPLVALHRLLGPGPVSGGALAPAPEDLGTLWQSARSTWLDAGLGAPGPADPLLTVLAALAVPFTAPDLAVHVLVLAAVPLAGLGAWAAAGAATSSVWLRAWAALVWAGAPALLVAVGTGRIGSLLAHAALPWVALGVTRAATAPTARRAWTTAAAAGLALAVAAAGAPVLLVLGTAAVLVVAAAALRPSRGRSLALLWTPLPALALSAPWLPAALADPRLLVAEPGRLLPADVLPAWQLLLGQPTTPVPWPVPAEPLASTLAVWAGAPLVAVAVLALLRGGPRGRAVRTGWFVVALGLAAAVLAVRVVLVPGAPGEPAVTGWPGPAVSVVVLGLLAAALVGADGARTRFGAVRGRRPLRGWRPLLSWRPLLAAPLALLALLAPVAVLGTWTWQQATGTAGPAVHASDVHRGEVAALPAVAVDAATSPDRTRTLVLRPEADGAVAAAVTRTGTERLDRLATAVTLRAGQTPDAADEALTAAVAGLTGPASARTDPRTALTDLGVGYVLLLDAAQVDEAAHPLTADTLDSVAGLSRSGEVDDGVLWRVVPASGEDPDAVDRAARVRVLDADGSPQAVLASGPTDVRAEVPAGQDGRTLVLAERADPHWSAYLDHRRLDPVVVDGWAQGFELGPRGGTVVVRHDPPLQGLWGPLQVVVLGLTALLALPLGDGTRRTPR